MKCHLSLLRLLLILAPLSAWAGGSDPVYPASSIPAELRKDAQAVVRLHSQHYQIQNRKQYVLRDTLVVTVLNMDGWKFTQFGQDYQKHQKITEFDVTVYDADGKKLRKLKPSEFVDQNAHAYDIVSYSETRIRATRVQEGTFPFTVVAIVTLESNGMYSFPDWYPKHGGGRSYERQVLRVSAPAGFPILHQSTGGMSEPMVTEAAGIRSYAWTLTNLPSEDEDEERLAPAYTDYGRCVRVAPGEFELYGQSGHFSSWAEYGKWISQIMTGRDDLSPTEAETVRQLTANAPTVEAKIDRLYEYMQGRVRYVAVYYGLGGLQPHAATETSANAYGDCKDLSIYMKAMLKASGVESYPVLIYRGIRGPSMQASFVDHQFNHMILAVPTGSDTLWLECTSTEAPTGYLGPDDDNRRVLLITPEGGKVAYTPHAPPEANRSVYRVAAQLTPTGGITAKVASIHTGHRAATMRSAATMAKADVDELILGGMRNTFATLEPDFSGAGRRAATARVGMILTAPRYASQAGTRLLINPNVVGRKLPQLPEAEANRKQDLVLAYPMLYRHEQVDTVQIQVPEGLVLDSSFPPQELRTDFASYHSSASFEPSTRTLTYTRFFRWDRTRFPASRYDEVRKFLQQVDKLDKTQMVLSKGT